MRRRTVVTLLALLAALPVPAGAATTRPGVPAYAVADFVRAARAAGLEELARALGARTGGTPDAPGEVSWAIPTPDLDGDRRDDVMDVRARDTTTAQEAEDGYWYSDVTTIARGRDGRALWRRTARRTAVVPLPARVGAAGAPGVVEVHVDVNLSRFAVTHLGFVAVDARGRVVGERHFAEADGAVPHWGGFVPGPDGAVAVLLGLRDPQPAGGVTFQPAVLSLDGAAPPRPSGPAIVTGPLPVTVYAVDDVDGDGRRDYAVVGTDLADPRGAFVETRSAPSGAVLWRQVVTGGLFGLASGAGDVTADGVPDVAAQVTRAGPDGRPAGEVMLYDGARGGVVWTVRGTRALPLGPVDGRPGAEIGVVTAEPALVAYGAGGTPLWRVGGEMASGLLEPHGDVDGDGAGDLFFGHHPPGEEYPLFGSHRHTGAVSGRTGAIRGYADGTARTRGVTWTAATGAADDPLRGAVDGRTPDFTRVDVAADGSSFTVVTLDAWTGAELWRARVPVAVTAGGEPRALDLDGDACADLVVPAIGAGNDLFAFRSDGSLLWAVRRSAGGADVRLRPAVTTTTSVSACR